MDEQEVMNVTVEAVDDGETDLEEEEQAVSVSTTTEINEKLVHLLAVITARRDVKSRKKTRYYYGLVVIMYALAAYWFYTYYILKTGTRGPIIMLLMLVMASFLLRYLRTPPVTIAESRMRPYLGQKWSYRFDDEGIHNTINGGNEGVFAWSELTCWWEEDGYLLLEVGGQLVAVCMDNLDEEEQEQLRGLCWVYLGDAKQENAAEQS